jgi:hypothetical protein
LTLSLHQAATPVFLRQLEALGVILGKAEHFAETKAIDPQTLLQARLAPDMHPLVRQVQIASDSAKGGVARLAGLAPPSYPDTEATFAEIAERLKKTQDFLKSVPNADVDAGADRTITLEIGGSTMSFAGPDFLFRFVIPNFYFHVTTAYAILRMSGVELGKRDFLGAA